MEDAEVSIISKHVVRPSPRFNGGGGGGERKPTEIIHLTPCDLRMLPIPYMQKGILFRKPHDQSMEVIISNLLTSFSRALDRFYPLAGRFRTAHHPDDDSISISLHCTDKGAEFVHASAPAVKISDIIPPGFHIPTIVHSFFPLSRIVSHDGHADPLIGVQVTELADGILVACSVNHAAADGNSFYRFYSTWSGICRNGVDSSKAVESPLDFERWFPDSVTPPVRLPFDGYQQFVRVPELQVPEVLECMFHFSSAEVKTLKARANEEMGCGDKISSLQALAAHVWRSVSRARALKPEDGTAYFLTVGFRSRLNPPLPEANYLENSTLAVSVKALAGEIESKGLGWTAWQLNQAVASVDEASVREWFDSWSRSPPLASFDAFGSAAVVVLSNTMRFDLYGNGYGWGRPVAVRSGPGNKMDGVMTMCSGVERGTFDMEICLPAEVMSSLREDGEFMDAVD